MKQPIDFVIITALEEELDALLARLPGYKKLPPSENSVRSYYQAEIPAIFPDGGQSIYRVIVMSLPGMGRVQAATATDDAIDQWHPRYLLLVGIAGGIAERKVNLGDILIPDQIADYELQKITEGNSEIRWIVHQVDPRLSDAERSLRSDAWVDAIGVERPETGKPLRHCGPIASGDKVVAFEDALKKYRSDWPKLIGVEMEAAGAAAAAFRVPHPPGFFMIRSVCDLANKQKGSEEVEKWRNYACNAAASYTIDFLPSGTIPAREIFLPHSKLYTTAIQGYPVKPDEFINREKELRTIFNRLRYGSSTAITGEHHIGKTSLLLKLQDSSTQNFYLDEDKQNLMMSYIDLFTVSANYTPTEFWSDAIKPFRNQIVNFLGAQYYDNVTQTDFKRDVLEQLFVQLGTKGKRLAILLDEFEILLRLPHFQDYPFFALLRSLATRTNGLAVVIAGRLSISKMNDWGQTISETGSPLFNYLTEVNLGLLDENSTNIFLDRAGLANPADRYFFRQVLGQHPCFLRVLTEFISDLGKDENPLQTITVLYERIAHHIDITWRDMDNRSRTALILLGLPDLAPQNEKIAPLIREIESLEEFGRELHKLEKNGLAKKLNKIDKKNSGKHGVSWRGEQWTISALVYTWWINEVVITHYRNVTMYNTWLVNKGYLEILPEKLWNDLVFEVQRLTNWTTQNLADANFHEEHET